MQELACETVLAGLAVVGVATDRVPDREKCARIWCVRPVSNRTRRSVARGSVSSISKWVRAARGWSVSIEWRVRTRRSRPIGASIVPRRAGGRPSTRARYSRTIRRAASAALRRRCAASLFATTSSPEVSRSSRWTMPGRHDSPPAAPRAASACESVRCGVRRPGGRPRRPACRRSAGPRPRRRPRTAPSCRPCRPRAAPQRRSRSSRRRGAGRSCARATRRA